MICLGLSNTHVQVGSRNVFPRTHLHCLNEVVTIILKQHREGTMGIDRVKRCGKLFPLRRQREVRYSEK